MCSVAILVFLTCVFGSDGKIPADVLELAQLTTPDIIKKYDYPTETHFVTTEDGYILAVHRIKREGAKPFLLQHGLEDSSATYVLMGPKISLAFLLWDQGYDVWMGNARGNIYARNHTTLDPNQKEFWQFSWNEIGYYDLPAIIDYVLKTTGHFNLFYVGHSQGTTVFFVMCSSRPLYNKKIVLMHALAPVAFLSHIKTPIYQLIKDIAQPIIRALGENELFPHGRFQGVCLQDDAKLQKVLIEGFFLVMGRNEKELNKTMWPAMCNHLPAGAATNQVIHYYQVIRSGRFSKYDFGSRKNLEKYRSKVPPTYDLSKIESPIVIYYSNNDYLAPSVDVEHLANLLPNVVEKYKVLDLEFNHMDFVWAINVRKLVYRRLMAVTANYI